MNAEKRRQAYARAHSCRVRHAGGVLRHRASIQAALLRRPGLGFLGQVFHVLCGGNGEKKPTQFECVVLYFLFIIVPVSAQYVPSKSVLFY